MLIVGFVLVHFLDKKMYFGTLAVHYRNNYKNVNASAKRSKTDTS